MTHRGRGGDITVQTLFQFTIGLGLPLVLTQVFGPGIHQEYFQIVVGDFSISEDPPPIGAIATPHAAVFMHRFQKFCYPFRYHSIVDRDEHRPLCKICSNFLDDHGHTPVVPGTQIRGRIRKFREKRDHYRRDGSDPSIDKRDANTSSLRDRTPSYGPDCIASLINQDKDSKDSCSYPIRRQVLDQSVNERDEDDPRGTADPHDRSEGPKTV